MSEVLSVDDIETLRQAILQHESVLMVGNRTKPSLSWVPKSTTLISAVGLTGIVEYEPSEFTFAARAGTPVVEIVDALAAKNQYLPFDPILPRTATIGGTLSAGLSGPGRHRFGGLRDFILGVEFISGDGDVIRAGSNVVKNAAGFDVPKLLVGSCGRLGALTQLTFKVFPRPIRRHTYSIHCDAHHQAREVVTTCASARWEADAVDYLGDSRQVWIRLCGETEPMEAIAKEIRSTFTGLAFERVDDELAEATWQRVTTLQVGDSAQDALVKIPCTFDAKHQWSELADFFGRSFHLSAAGNLLWGSLESSHLCELSSMLDRFAMEGLVIRGNTEGIASCWIGHRDDNLSNKIKHAMDPPNRFANWSMHPPSNRV
ncbi:MAG: FAD-binding protein [Planctomycetota bacterium]